MRILVLLITGATLALSNEESNDKDGEESRKILGSSVVTSVSVIMDTGNGSKAVYTDAVGKPVPKPSSASELASPINLLNPDRYEFYTFDDNGDLIKRLMSLEEIQGIIATGDSDGYDLDSFTSLGYLPEKRVNDVVNNVQNVLKEEMETHKNQPELKPMFDTPDVSDSWSMILPAVFGNSGEDIKPEKPIIHVTPDTIMIEPNAQNTNVISFTQKVETAVPNTVTPFHQVSVTSPRSTTSVTTSRSTTKSQLSYKKPTVTSTPPQMSTADKLITLHTQTTNKTSLLSLETQAEAKPMINVEISSNSNSTEKPLDQIEIGNSAVVEIKPLDTIKDENKPIYGTKITTQKPLITPSISVFSIKPSTQKETETKYTPVKIEENTKSPATLMSFTPSSLGSTLPTTKISTVTLKTTYVPLTTFELITQAPTTVKNSPLTERTTEAPTSSSSIKSSSTIVTESPTIKEEIPVTTIKSRPTTIDFTQGLVTKSESPQNDSPTLSELLNLNENAEIIQDAGLMQDEESTTITTPENTPSSFTTFSANNDEKIKDITTTEGITSHTKFIEKSDEDLTTLSSEYFSSKNNLPTTHQTAETTTQLSLEQSTNPDQKLSATELLGQLLFTTNIYEINTELAEKTSEQQTVNNDNERFESSTQEESMISEVKTEVPATTEQFLIKLGDNKEQFVTDRTVIDSIEQLLSQATDDVEEGIVNNNDTEKIQDMLINSGKKNMTEIQKESATLASEIIGNSNIKEENEKIATEATEATEATQPNDSSILSESLGSLLSQIYDSDQPNTATIEYAPVTEKYLITTVLNRKTDDISSTANIVSTEKYKLGLATDETTEKYDKIIEEQETTVPVEATTISYIPLIPTNKNESDKDYTSHLINITIISSEGTKTNTNNRTKPSKADVSLEKIFAEDIKQNVENILSENEPTEIYIERTSSTTEKSNNRISVANGPNEILKTEETVAALFNNTLINKNVKENDPQSNTLLNETSVSLDPVAEKIAEISTESELTTVSSFTPAKEKEISDRPTTIIIIKRTEKPLIEEQTTITSLKQNEDPEINTDRTTTFAENLGSTTYVKPDIETIEALTEAIMQTTTELTQEDITESNVLQVESTESTTELVKEGEPVIDIIISENNKPLSEQHIERHTSNNTETSTNKNSSQKGVENKLLDEENNKPQETSNINVKISNDMIPSHNKKGNADNSPTKFLQNEKVNRSEITPEKKPESTWTLVPTISPHSDERVVQNYSPPIQNFPEIIEPAAPIDLVAKPLQGFGLEDSTSRLDTDIYQFAQLCNELAFGFWKTVTSGISSARSVFVSPFGATSLLAMVFLGARGATSGEMNEILKLDDMVTFNPHLIFKNVSESIRADEPDSGVSSSAIIRELFSDRSKGRLLPFYKERAKAFYDGYVEEASFREIGDVIRRRTNLQVKKYTNGKMTEFLKDGSVTARPPLAGVSVNIFQTDCSQASTDGRDGELHFVVLPSIRQRRLIPVPAVVYKSGFLAGYEPSLDATAVSLGTKDQIVSTILVIPGQQGVGTPGDGLARLERRLVESSFKKGAWSRLLRSLIPRPGLEVQIPRFSHKSIINATVTLKKMGLHDLFDVEKADLRGLNGVANELFLSDMLQINCFATCGEKRITDTHHSEIYPASATRAQNARYLENYQSEEISYYRRDLLEEPRDYQRAFHDPLHDPSYLSLPLSLRPRQARVPEAPRLRFDRPFIYFIRHNPTGLILHMGRFNPRLLP